MRSLFTCLALGLCAFASATAATQADQIRIARIRSHMADNLTRLPNYTCTQTIERFVRPARSRRLRLVDTLRLEVALVDGRELFAWPGSGKFEDRELREMIGNGASGNGNFGLHARAVFLSGQARFDYLGEVETEEGRVFSYSYNVPQQGSGYMIRTGSGEATTGYHGYFEADVESLDILSFDVIADEEIPPSLQLLEAITRMRYGRMTIGGSEFLLPESSEISLTDYHRDENRNLIQLTNCRQYGTESTIRFDDPPPEETSAAAVVPPVPAGPAQVGELPMGLGFDAELLTSLKFPGLAVGDLVELRVAGDVKKKGAMMIPKGTLARGRVLYGGIVPMGRTQGLAIRIELIEIDLPGGHAEVHGVAQRVPPVGSSGSRQTVDNGLIVIVSGYQRELRRGTRIYWSLEPKPETR